MLRMINGRISTDDYYDIQTKVFYKGQEINFRNFIHRHNFELDIFSTENCEWIYFKSTAAQVLLGQRADVSLYILFDKMD
jgi:hypothetical protein